MNFIFQQGQVGRFNQPDASGVGDPDFGSVIYLNNRQGPNGSTTTGFTDQSPVGRTLTVNGNAQISTAEFVFGTSSAYFDGSGDSEDDGTGTDLTIVATTSWTREHWFRPDESSYTGGISALQGLQFYENGGGGVILGTQYYSAAAASRRTCGAVDNNSTGPTAAITLAAGTWYFVQEVNDGPGDTYKVFIGLVGAGTGTQYVSTTRKGLNHRYWGAGGSPGLDYFKGYLGPSRITSGIARANAVPTGLFPTS